MQTSVDGARALWRLGIVWALALAGCPDHDDQVVAEVDASEPEAEVTPLPEDRHVVRGLLDPPGVASLPGWVVMNRYGQWTTNAKGEVDFEVAREGLTLSLVLPPGSAAADPELPAALVVASVLLSEEPAPATMTLDARAGAVGLMFMDPRAASLDALELAGLMAEARVNPAVAALGERIDQRFDVRGLRRLYDDPEVLAALDEAADAVLARTRSTGPWQTTDLPRDASDDSKIELIRGRGPHLVDLSVEGGVLALERLPLVPGALRFEARVVDVDSLAAPRRTALPALLEDGEETPGAAPFASGLLAPRGAGVELRGSQLTGAVTLPEDSLVELRVVADRGLAAEGLLAGELGRRYFPTDTPCPTVAVDADAGLAAALAAVADCALIPATAAEREAGNRLMVLGRELTRRALTRHASSPLGRGLDPRSAWTPLGEALEERALVLVGAPLTPRPRLVSGPADGVLAPGAVVEVAGPLVGHERTALTLRDAFHRHVKPAVERRGEAWAVTVPEGLGGEVTLVALGDGGAGELALGRMESRVARLVPDVLTAPGPVRFEGRGFFPGQVLAVGGHTLMVPNDVLASTFTVQLDPALIGPGLHAIGDASLLVPAGLTVVSAPTTIARGASLVVTLGGVAPDEALSARAGELEVPVRFAVRGPERGELVLNLDGGALGAGEHTVVIAAGTRTASFAVTVVDDRPSLERAVAFHATNPPDRPVELSRALAIANGTTLPNGRFQRVDMGFKLGNQWHCPLDIEPDAAAIQPETCTSTYQRCDEGWYWDDKRDGSRWIEVTRPPGRGSTGVRCPVIPGPDSWEGVGPTAVYDRVTTEDAVPIGGQVLRGPWAELALPEARGGGLAVQRPAAGGRSELVLDLVIDDAVSTADDPVLALDGVEGVKLRLTINGRVGQCHTALHVSASREVDVEALVVRNCGRALEILDSEDVRVGRDTAPAMVIGAQLGARVEESRDVVMHVRLGTLVDPAYPTFMERAALAAGVVITGSERVAVAGNLAGIAGDALNVSDSEGVRVGPLEVGFARAPDGTVSWAELGVGRGVVVSGGRDVVLAGSTVVQAGDAVVARGGAELEVVGCALGAVDEGFGTGTLSPLPPGNSGRGVVAEDAAVVIGGALVGRNASGGVVAGATSGLVIDGLRSGSAGGLGRLPGDQPCAIELAGTRGVLLRGLALDGDEVGVCATGGELAVERSEVRAALGVRAEGAALDLVQVALSGARGLELDGVSGAMQGAWIDVEERAVALEDRILQAAPFSLSMSQIASDDVGLAVASEVQPVYAFATEITADGVALEVDGAPLVSYRGASLRAGVDAKGPRLVLRGGRLWMPQAGVEGAARVEGGRLSVDTTGGPMEVAATGEVDLELRVGDGPRKGIGAIDLGGVVVVRGGDWDLDLSGTARVDVADARLGGGVARGVALALARSSVGGALRLERASESRLADVSVGEGLTIVGGRQLRLARVQAALGIGLLGPSEGVTVFGEGLIDGPGLPVGEVVTRPFVGRAGAVVRVEGLPEHARVALARVGPRGPEVLARGFARGGVARFPGVVAGDEVLVAAVTTASGATGPWRDAAGASPCEARAAPAEDEAAWAAWAPRQEAAGARCGELEVKIEQGERARLVFGEATLMEAAAIEAPAFSYDCARLVWVAEGVNGEVEASPDVYLADTVSGVVTRLTRDAAREEAPFPGPDGRVWFGRRDGGAAVLAAWSEEAGDAHLVLALGEGDATWPRPAPGADAGLVFLACGEVCRLMALAGDGTVAPLGVPADAGCDTRAPRWVESGQARWLVVERGPDADTLVPVSATRDGLVRGQLSGMSGP